MTTRKVVDVLFGGVEVALVVLTLAGLVVWIGMHSWPLAALFAGGCLWMASDSYAYPGPTEPWV